MTTSPGDIVRDSHATGLDYQRRATGLALPFGVMVLGLGLITAGQMNWVRSKVESDLVSRSTAALGPAGYSSLKVAAQGRDLSVAGVRDAAAADSIRHLLGDLNGVRVVNIAGFPAPASGKAAPASPGASAPMPGSGSATVSDSPNPLDTATESPTVTITATAPAEPTPAATGAYEALRAELAKLPAIRFASRISGPDTTSRRTVDKIAALLLAYPDAKITITGHTDNRGTDRVNRELSYARADVVAKLLAKRGVDRTRIDLVAMGEKKPLVNNDTKANRATNRRVEVGVKD